MLAKIKKIELKPERKNPTC